MALPLPRVLEGFVGQWVLRPGVPCRVLSGRQLRHRATGAGRIRTPARGTPCPWPPLQHVGTGVCGAVTQTGEVT